MESSDAGRGPLARWPGFCLSPLSALARLAPGLLHALKLALGGGEADVDRFWKGGGVGIGLVFIVETFSKPNEEGSIYVTFVNMGSKETLFSERLAAEPKGFGMRNFWAGCVYGVLTKMQKKEFANWKKKYYRP